MINITAQIIVEHGSRYNPVVVPFETLLLDESGPVPVWILKEQNIKWKVTSYNKFEDALLMAALLILKDSELEDFACDYFSHLDNYFFDNVDLNVNLTAEHLELLYQKNREVCSWKRLIINVFDGCSHADLQMEALEEYSMNVEVGITTYRRSVQNGEKIEIYGHDDFDYS